MQESKAFYEAICTLRGLGALSPDMDERFNDIIAMVRQAGNVTFRPQPEEEEEEDDVLAAPLNATFCLPSAPPAPAPVPRLVAPPAVFTGLLRTVPSVSQPQLSSRAPVDTTNRLPVPMPHYMMPKKLKVSPIQAGSSTTSTVQRTGLPIATPTHPRLSMGFRTMNPAGNDKRNTFIWRRIVLSIRNYA